MVSNFMAAYGVGRSLARQIDDSYVQSLNGSVEIACLRVLISTAP